jgi:hypothetical protein
MIKTVCRWSHDGERWKRVGNCYVLWNGNRQVHYFYAQ